MSLFTCLSRAALACWLLAGASMSSCGSNDDGDLCSSIKARSDGLHTSSCARGAVHLSQVVSDSAGTPTSYAFVISCGNGNSAHGTWSSAGGLACVPGAYTVCDGGACIPMSGADCANSTNCDQLGECGYGDGGCVLTEDGCAHSAIPCGISGACHLGPGGTCTVMSDADCLGTSCVDCSFKGPCVTSGKCVQENGVCVARTDAACKKSEQCAFAGQCSLQDDACLAATDADCTPSEVCRTAAQCQAIDGVCGVK